MRFLLFLLALTLAPPTSAQDAANIAGFRIGMTAAEVAAVDDSLAWSSDLTRPRFNASGHGRQFAGMTLSTFDLIFQSGALEFVGGGGLVRVESVEACEARLLAFLAEIERGAGALTASEANARPTDLEPLRTPGGTYVRRYESSPGTTGFIAEAHAPVSIDVSGGVHVSDRGVQCTIGFGMSAASQPPADLPLSTITEIEWLAFPPVYRYYPRAAMQYSRPGQVILICTVAEDGSLTECRVGYENPTGWGFGEAALRVSREVRMAPQTRNGAPTAGATVRQTIRFAQAY